MSNNVVPLFKKKQETVIPSVDNVGILTQIVRWAETHGIDVQNDIGFQVRLTDFTTYLDLAAKEGVRKIA